MDSRYEIEDGVLTWVDANIEEFEIPEDVKEIGTQVFHNCRKLKKLVINGGIEIIKEHLFEYKPDLIEIIIKKGIKKIESWAFAYCTNLKKVEIEEGVEEIGVGVFWGCYELKDLVLPESIKVYGTHIVEYTGLVKIEELLKEEFMTYMKEKDLKKRDEIVLKRFGRKELEWEKVEKILYDKNVKKEDIEYKYRGTIAGRKYGF